MAEKTTHIRDVSLTKLRPPATLERLEVPKVTEQPNTAAASDPSIPTSKEPPVKPLSLSQALLNAFEKPMFIETLVGLIRKGGDDGIRR